MSADQYFENLGPTMQEICLELRKIVFASLPNVREELKWNVPTYSITKNICSIMAHNKHVNFQIFQGAHIKNSHLLEGTGKNMRHMKFVSLDEIEKNVIQQCLKQAEKLGSL